MADQAIGTPDLEGNDRVVRDPEDRSVSDEDVKAIREKNLDKTLADTFPTSDPPSSIPDPSEAED